MNSESVSVNMSKVTVSNPTGATNYVVVQAVRSGYDGAALGRPVSIAPGETADIAFLEGAALRATLGPPRHKYAEPQGSVESRQAKADAETREEAEDGKPPKIAEPVVGVETKKKR